VSMQYFCIFTLMWSLSSKIFEYSVQCQVSQLHGRLHNADTIVNKHMLLLNTWNGCCWNKHLSFCIFLLLYWV
jgi:hypothetical protein